MTVRQLVDLNGKLCKRYEEDLVEERHNKRNKAAEDAKKKSELKKKGSVYGQPWLGPPLQKKRGKYRYDDNDQEKGQMLYKELLAEFKEIGLELKYLNKKLGFKP